MKIKKIMAMLLAATMIMGSTVSTFAETGKTPVMGDTTPVSVSNVDKGATVYAYQIVEGDYNTNGFVKYVSVKDGDTVLVENPTAPTTDEIKDIIERMNRTENPLILKKVEMVDKDAEEKVDGTYTANLNAGLWIVLVESVGDNAEIYNPMLVSARYNVSGSDGSMEAGNISADDNWSLNGDIAWAKSSTVPFEKQAKNTANFGEAVDYTITTTIPMYSENYKNVTFTVKDTLAAGDLKLTDGVINVKANGTPVEPGDDAYTAYTVAGNEANSTEYTVTFNSAWVLNNRGKNIEISYKATVTGNKVNNASHDNTATLTYSTTTKDTSVKKDTEKVYSFDIGGEVTGDIFKKTGEDEDSDALKDAEFTLYTDEGCTTQYTNELYDGTTATYKTLEDGNIYIRGLDAGTYYLKETKAPKGYSLNDTVYTIEVNPTIENEVLKSWTIAVNGNTVRTFTVNNGVVTVSGETETEIKNTKLADLPETGGIGTTIFTIGGCAIMIAAAGLFFASRRKANK